MRMRLLALADIHAEQQALDHLAAFLKHERFDAILYAGDFTQFGPAGFASDVLDVLQRAAPVYAVPGNLDTPDVLELLKKRGVSVHGETKKLGDWKVAGWGGSPKGFVTTPIQFTEEQIWEGLAALDIGPKTILVTHAPPRGIGDISSKGEHAGSTSIRRIIEERQPALHICAHIHQQEGIFELGPTKIVKVAPAKGGRAAVIKLDRAIDTELISFW